MPIRIYNTLTRRKEDFVPLDRARSRIYVCGVTVYDYSHIGHARSALVFDVIRRYLRFRGLWRPLRAQLHGRGRQDHPPRATPRASPRGTSPSGFIEAERTDMASLGLLPPDVEPKATEHIPQMIAAHRAADRGRGWPTRWTGTSTSRCGASPTTAGCPGRTWTSSWRGRASRWTSASATPATSRSGSRPSPASPRGTAHGARGGRAGTSSARRWRCEHLGETIDIHGGGSDLIFPHHECEIAQTEACHRQALRALLGAQRLRESRRREDVEVAGQHAVHPRAGEAARSRGPPPLPARHPLPEPARVRGGAHRGGGAGVEPAARGGGGSGAARLTGHAAAGPRPRPLRRGRRASGSASRPPWTTTSTARRPSGVLFDLARTLQGARAQVSEGRAGAGAFLMGAGELVTLSRSVGLLEARVKPRPRWTPS